VLCKFSRVHPADTSTLQYLPTGVRPFGDHIILTVCCTFAFRGRWSHTPAAFYAYWYLLCVLEMCISLRSRNAERSYLFRGSVGCRIAYASVCIPRELICVCVRWLCWSISALNISVVSPRRSFHCILSTRSVDKLRWIELDSWFTRYTFISHFYYIASHLYHTHTIIVFTNVMILITTPCWNHTVLFNWENYKYI